jgi:small subunit ribosomal protein S7
MPKPQQQQQQPLFVQVSKVGLFRRTMSRRKQAKKRLILPDPNYKSVLVSLVINRILKDGKKTLAQSIVYKCLDKITELTGESALEVFSKAITNITPQVEVKAKRIGGSTYQVPRPVSEDRGTTLAIRWLVTSARARSGKGFILKLANEIIDASKETGNSVRKREEIEKMAEANQAFSRFRV